MVNVAISQNPTRAYALRAARLKSLTYNVTAGAWSACASATTAAVPGAAKPLTPALRRHPHPLHLAGVRRHRPDLGLEDDPAVLDPGVRTTAGHQVVRPARGTPRRRGPSGETPTSSVNIATAAGMRISSSSTRTRRTAGSGSTSGARSSAMNGWPSPHRARRSPRRLQDPPERLDHVDRADDRRALAPLPPGPLGEGDEGVRTGLDGHQVGAGEAERLELAADRPAPQLAAQPPRVQPERDP